VGIDRYVNMQQSHTKELVRVLMCWVAGIVLHTSSKSIFYLYE